MMPNPSHQDHWVWPLYEKGLTLIPLGTAGEQAPPYLVQRAGSQAEANEQWPKIPREKWADWQKFDPPESKITEWLLKYPRCNFAVVTGKTINVVDADDQAAIDFIQNNLTRTPWKVKTGKGAHFYYQTSPTLIIKNSADKSKIDIRGVGGYVVAPGSTHHSGRQYTLDINPNYPIESIHDLPVLSGEDLQKINEYRELAKTPPAAIQMGPGTRLIFDATQYSPYQEQGTPKGSRDDNMTRLVGKWIQEGLSLDQLMARAKRTDEGNSPPLGEANLLKIIQSVTGTHLRNNKIAAEVPVIPESGIDLTRVTDMDLAKPIDYLVDDFLIEKTTSLIWGPPGCGKSFVAIDIGLHVATGIDWHGHQVSQGDVVYVCGEGFNGIPLRVGAWKKHHEVAGSIPFFMTHQAVPIAAAGVAAALLDSIKAVSDNPRMVIIDTLNRNFGAGSENDQADMDLYLDASHRICNELGANVLTVHHSGKDASRGPRGSTGLTGAVYTNLEMCKPGPDEWTLITHKQKDGPEAHPIRIEMPYISMGEATDNRGRIRPIGSLVVEVMDDVTLGASVSAGIINGPQKKAGKNQSTLIRVCRKQTENIPTDQPKTIDRKQLIDALDLCGIPKNRRSELLVWAQKEGVLVPISAKNTLVLTFNDPKSGSGF